MSSCDLISCFIILVSQTTESAHGHTNKIHTLKLHQEKIDKEIVTLRKFQRNIEECTERYQTGMSSLSFTNFSIV